ncbi:hypothetical protein DBR28_12630 [Chryseobacterium sp. HMWF028]|nr:hypothetical protein DBR28_12630 [Chryseobacterium sp. HMWF028]
MDHINSDVCVFHLPNIFFGIGLFGLIRVPIAFGMGSVFYLARRTAGTLIASMALHALWDFSVFATDAPIRGFVGPVLGILAIVVVVIQLSREKNKIDKKDLMQF